MITIIICSIIGATIALFTTEKGLGIGWKLLTAVFGMFLGWVCGLLIFVLLPTSKIHKNETIEIVSLQDNSTYVYMHCSYSQKQYSFYYKDGESFKLMDVNCDDAEIRYTTEKPYILVGYYIADANSIYNKFALVTDLRYNVHYIIYVPEGTIKNEFSLDAK